MKKVLFATAALLCSALPASAAAPDLVGEFNPATAYVTVRNVGDGRAARSVLTIKCRRMRPPVVGGGGCPDLPLRLPRHPAFPGIIAVSVGDLAPGAVFVRRLSFFNGLVFESGTYGLSTTVDATRTVAESNEANNVSASIKVVP